MPVVSRGFQRVSGLASGVSPQTLKQVVVAIRR